MNKYTDHLFIFFLPLIHPKFFEHILAVKIGRAPLGILSPLYYYRNKVSPLVIISRYTYNIYILDGK